MAKKPAVKKSAAKKPAPKKLAAKPKAGQAELVQAVSEAIRIFREGVVEEDLRHRRRPLEGRPLLLSPAMVPPSAT